MRAPPHFHRAREPSRHRAMCADRAVSTRRAIAAQSLQFSPAKLLARLECRRALIASSPYSVCLPLCDCADALQQRRAEMLTRVIMVALGLVGFVVSRVAAASQLLWQQHEDGASAAELLIMARLTTTAVQRVLLSIAAARCRDNDCRSACAP